MKVHNALPLFLSCMQKWAAVPTVREFAAEYFEPLSDLVGVVFDGDASAFHSVLGDLNWELFREESLALDPAREEARLMKHLRAVEELFGFKLEGEAVLFGAFTCMDGYARFDRGTHRVFLGVDESHGRGAYLDVLIAHELTHVARESRPEVWRGFGLDPKMTHDEFTENQPVIEHLIGEGFSCLVSELLVPGEEKWHYAYQTEDSLALVLEHGPAVDQRIHAEIRKPDGDYGSLYNTRRYGTRDLRLPQYSHYVWGWQWAKRVLADLCGGDPRRLVGHCSKDWTEHALAFKLTRIA